MADLTASAPVKVPGTADITYDKWFLTQLISKVSPDKAFTIIHLTRSAVVDGKTVLMTTGDNEISFTLDVMKEMVSTPELASAWESILNAVVAYATKKNLL